MEDAWPGTIALRDGTTLAVHPMRASDKVRLQRFHGTLSQDTTYLRFFSVHPELSTAELHRFTEVDHCDREAVVATAGRDIVGVARYDRLDDRTEAEVAFVVADSWQGRGVGTALLAHLAARARQEGIRRFVADTLPHNHRMLAVFHHAGLPVTATMRDGVIRVVMELD